jgi:CubicO group peptidase (beta-lactamase class C family)
VRDRGNRKILALGIASQHPDRRLAPDDTVMVASVTKALVATAAMSLIQDGSLALDDSVEKCRDCCARVATSPSCICCR